MRFYEVMKEAVETGAYFKNPSRSFWLKWNPEKERIEFLDGSSMVNNPIDAIELGRSDWVLQEKLLRDGKVTIDIDRKVELFKILDENKIPIRKHEGGIQVWSGCHRRWISVRCGDKITLGTPSYMSTANATYNL